MDPGPRPATLGLPESNFSTLVFHFTKACSTFVSTFRAFCKLLFQLCYNFQSHPSFFNFLDARKLLFQPFRLRKVTCSTFVELHVGFFNLFSTCRACKKLLFHLLLNFQDIPKVTFH